jgi:hypothetical protein
VRVGYDYARYDVCFDSDASVCYVRSFSRVVEEEMCTRRDMNAAGFTDEVIDQASHEGIIVSVKAGRFITAIE